MLWAGGTAVASVVWTRLPMGLRIEALAALGENCEKRRPMRDDMTDGEDIANEIVSLWKCGGAEW